MKKAEECTLISFESAQAQELSRWLVRAATTRIEVSAEHPAGGPPSVVSYAESVMGPSSHVGEHALSERELRWRGYLSAVQSRDPRALSALYDDTVAALHGLALRILSNPADAEEVILDVFEQIWRRPHTFDPNRGGVWHWLVVMTRSRAIDRLRAHARRAEREKPADEMSQGVASSTRTPDELSILSEQRSLILRALEALPAEQREVIELAYFAELTHSEVSAKLGLPLGTIKTRIRIAMEKLRLALAGPLAGSVGAN